jgi:hypothetical protein
MLDQEWSVEDRIRIERLRKEVETLKHAIRIAELEDQRRMLRGQLRRNPICDGKRESRALDKPAQQTKITGPNDGKIRDQMVGPPGMRA